MTTSLPDSTLAHFTTFGDLLKFLRRRAGLTQRELSIAVGYSTAQICRLEQNQRLPDLPTLAARFVPELGLTAETQAAARLLELAATVRREDAPATGVSPFRGLLYFDEGDADLFVGRERLTTQLMARLLASSAAPAGLRFLAVVGASGSGKSSVIRAGLLPALRWNPAAAGWLMHVLTPTAHPLEALASSVLGEGASSTALAALADALSHNPAGLQHVLEQRAQRAGGAPTLFVVDQFEELFTLCRGEAERHAFVDNLLTAAEAAGGPAAVVIALRADFYGHCAVFPRLRAALAQQQEFIGAMTAADLRRAIEEPAQRGHWELEPGLVDQLLQDVGAEGAGTPEPGALPLLSHALLETWERRRGNTLTLSGYAASGGVRGAIAETAEAVFRDQLTPPQRAIARHIFLRLTELGESDTVPDTRRRVSLEELVAQPAEAGAVREVLTLLADARLITTDDNTAEVAHEALIREWPTLREWLAEDREGLRLHRRLTEAAQEWERTGRDEAELLRGARLAQAVEWAAANPGTLNAREQAFLEAAQALVAREAAERDQQRQRELEAAQRLAHAEQRRAADSERTAGQLRRRAVYFAGAFVVALLMAGAALFFGEQARQAALTAQTSERTAFARELAAAAVSNLDIDPERSLLLALQAGAETATHNDGWTAEAEDALHRALEASRVELTLRGHTALVAAAIYSPDQRSLATVSDDGTLRLWDAATGQPRLNLATGIDRGHHGLSYSPDGTRIVTAGPSWSAKVWDPATGQEQLTLLGHNDLVSSVAFSPDGTRIATGSEDRTARVWDAATGQSLLILSGHADAVWAVAFSPDGTRLATASQDETVRLWDATTGQLLLTLRGHTKGINSVTFSPACADTIPACPLRLVTASDDGTAQIWDAVTGAALLTLRGHSAAVADAAFSPECPYSAARPEPCTPRVVTAGFDGRINVWDSVTGQLLLSLAGHTGPVVSAAFSRDGTRVVSASFDGTAKTWNVGLSRELATLPVADYAVSTMSPACVSAPATPAESCPPRLALGLTDGTVSIWDLTGVLGTGAAAGQPVLTFPGHTSQVSALAFSADGTRLATAGSDGTAKVWDAATGQALLTLAGQPAGVVSIAFSPDGARLATANQDYTVRVWDAATGQELLKLWRPGANAVAFSPACAASSAAACRLRLAVAEENGTATLWDADTGDKLQTLRGHTDAVLSVAFNADGTRLATSSVDGTAKVWDTATGQTLLTLRGHTGDVNGVAFATSDGQPRLITISQDGTAKVWDADTGREVLTLRGQLAPVVGLAVTAVCSSPPAGLAAACGARLLTAGADGTLRFYLLDTADLVALARTRLTRTWTTAECQQYLHQEQCPPTATPPTAQADAVVTPPPAATPAAHPNQQVCEITDERGVHDQFFNQLTNTGLRQAADTFGWTVTVMEPRAPTDYESELDTALAAGCELIVIPAGYAFSDITRVAAQAHPGQKFVIMDLAYDPPLDRVWAHVAASDQAGFLAGYAAAAVTQTGQVGTFGGIKRAEVTAFMDGFALGVAYYNAQHGTQVAVLGWDTETQTGLFTGNFESRGDAQRLGQQLLDLGADVIMPVDGVAGLGAAAAVKAHGEAYVIGVDLDWAVAYPEFADITLTTIEKRVDVTARLAVAAVVNGNFTGGTHLGTLATGEVGVSPVRNLDSHAAEQLTAELEQITAEIIAGKIVTKP